MTEHLKNIFNNPNFIVLDPVSFLRIVRNFAFVFGPLDSGRILFDVRLLLSPIHRMETSPPVALLSDRLRKADAEKSDHGSG